MSFMNPLAESYSFTPMTTKTAKAGTRLRVEMGDQGNHLVFIEANR